MMLAPLLTMGVVAEESDGALPALRIIGVESDLEANIRKSIHPERYNCNDEDWQLKRLLSKTAKQTNLALQALGYYRSQIVTEISRHLNCWALIIQVEPGEQVKLKSVSIQIQGALEPLPAMQAFLVSPPITTGADLNHDQYTQTKAVIQRLATSYGFFQGEFSRSRLDIDPDLNQAEVQLDFTSGPRSHFGEIRLEQSLFDQILIDQYLILKKGQPYDSRALVRQQQALISSGYFSLVKVIADHERRQPDGDIPIEIQLVPVKQHAYQYGLGASTDTGPRLNFGFKNRRLNERGHQYDFDTLLSPKNREVTFDYGIPRGKAGAERLDFQVGYQFENLETFEEESLQLAVLNTDTYESGWLRSIFLEYLKEDFVVAETPGRGELLMPGIRFRKTTADMPLYPLKGWRLETSVRIADEAALSSTDLLQITFGHKRILPLFSGRILARINLGASLVSDFESLPASKRFFAGGDSSVRGFDYKTLGPLNDEGEVTGGENLLTASIEYEYLILEKWGLAGFVDTGNAFNRIDELDLYTGAGFGVRWYSPVGPIRLDAAQDISQENSPRLHLSMGLDL